MKLIAGKYGGRSLKTVADKGLRPAMAKTREAIFSMLESRGIDWANTRVLDLFAGCGSLGLEALSRGAPIACFVDNGIKPFQCLLANINLLSLGNAARAHKMDVLKFLRQHAAIPYELVFLDPPYRNNYAQACLHGLLRGQWLASGTLVVAELESDAAINISDEFLLDTTRKFGQTNIHFWIKQ